MNNKEIEKLLKDEDYRVAIEGALQELGKIANLGSKEFATAINPLKMACYIKASKTLADSTNRGAIEVKESFDTITSSGTIIVCGENINFLKTSEVAQALSYASNFNVYINSDGKPQIDLVFYEIMRRI